MEYSALFLSQVRKGALRNERGWSHLMVAALRRNRSLERDVLEREIARVKAEKRRALQKLNGEGA